MIKKRKGRLSPPLSSTGFSVLEGELQTKLNQPWIAGGGNASEVRTTNASIGVTEISVVEDIEELRSEFKYLVLTYSGPLKHRKVEVDSARPVEHVATEISESACPIEQSRVIGSANSTEEGVGSG